MRRIFTFLAAILFTATTFAQAPEKMSYQAVIRDASNDLVINQSIGMKISILQSSPSGNVVYAETQTPITNDNGLVNIEIGNGTVLSGNFSSIDWPNGPFFIKTEIDPSGLTSYTITAISQLLSVPYALHSKTAESIIGQIEETDPQFISSVASGIKSSDIVNWNDDKVNDGDTTYWKVYGNKIFYNKGDVGIGTSNPISKFHINNDTNGNDSSVFISKAGNIRIGTSLDWANAFTIYRSMKSSDVVFSQHDGQIRILNGNGDKALVIGSLDDGKGFIQANEVNVGYLPLLLNPVSGNVGIGTSSPERTLHVNSVMRLEPIPTAPSSPSQGDIYFDSTLKKLRVYDGTTWQNCW